MAFEKVSGRTESHPAIYSCLTTDTKDTDGIFAGDICYEDGGRIYIFSATGWSNQTTSRAEFTPSSYTGKVTSTEDGTTGAIASGATKLSLQSLETTSITEFAVLAFGTSAADAQTNLSKSGTTPNIISESGVIIQSGDSTLGIMPGEQIVGIPSNATHYALGNGTAADDQVVMVIQGV